MKLLKKTLAGILAITAISACAIVPASAASKSGSLNDLIYYTVELKKPLLFGDAKGSSNFTFAVDSHNWIKEGINGSSYIRIIANDYGFSDSKHARVAKGTNYANTGDLKATGYRSGVKSWHNGSICYRGTNRLMMELPSEINLSL